jgi:hypothetical protein
MLTKLFLERKTRESGSLCTLELIIFTVYCLFVFALGCHIAIEFTDNVFKQYISFLHFINLKKKEKHTIKLKMKKK